MNHFFILFSFNIIPWFVVIIIFEGSLKKKSACRTFPSVLDIKYVLSPWTTLPIFQITVYSPNPLIMNFYNPSFVSSNLAGRNLKSFTPYFCTSSKDIYSLIGLGLESKAIFLENKDS